jgi:asparagine synthase (glutamine-hydrolysing)
MPGLSLITDASGSLRREETTIRAALESLRHFPDYVTRIVALSGSYAVGTSSYDGYPLAVLEEGAHLVVLEGCVYNETETTVRRALADAARAVFVEHRPPATVARRIVDSFDGDFLVAMLDRATGAVVVVNDRFGRLPVYYAADAGRLVLSRELRFVVRSAGVDELDTMAVAQFLLFGYPLGTRTVFAAVSRLPAASVLWSDPHDGSMAVSTLHTYDFDDRGERRTENDRVAALVDTFRRAVEARVRPDHPTVLSLSGGLDSRAVAAALHGGGAPFVARTLLDARGQARADAERARQVAAALGIPWRLCELPAPRGADILTLLGLKEGANYLGMCFVVPFLEAVRAECGPRTTFFTGDQGDKILGDIVPVVRLDGMAALTEYIAARERIVPLEDVVAITGVARDDLLHEIAARLRSYPEREPGRLYVHFLFYERALKWLFEGEDRNRCFFWSVTPFYAREFFEHAMSASDEERAYGRLRRAFMETLSPTLAGIANASTGAPIGSLAHRVKEPLQKLAKSVIYGMLPVEVERALRRALRREDGYGADSTFVRCVRDQMSACADAPRYLRNDAVERLLAKAPEFSREHFGVILTISSAIERLTSDGGTLRSYRDATFA